MKITDIKAIPLSIPLKETKDPIWIGFLKRESNILLRRTFKAWWQLRFRKYLEVNRS